MLQTPGQINIPSFFKIFEVIDDKNCTSACKSEIEVKGEKGFIQIFPCDLLAIETYLFLGCDRLPYSSNILHVHLL